MRLDAWSRRKAAVAAEAEAELAHEEAVAAEELDARDDQDILDELDLPAPETIDSPDDIREFLNAPVSKGLKTRAWRRLWRLNPVYARLDGLVDYGEDFTDAATVVENLQTAYQVGKGMLSHIEAMAEAEAAKEEGDAAEGVPDLLVDAPEDEDATVLASHEEPEAVAVEEPEALEDEVEVLMPVRRRMVFAFDGESASQQIGGGA
jgi:hypothetical protein